MSNYRNQLEELYKDSDIETKLEFISMVIFDFHLADKDMDETFAIWMIEVLECILNQENTQYIEESFENYTIYLIMVNMPFLKNKLECGTSIRGAWFEEYNSHWKMGDHYLIGGNIKVLKIDFKNFVKELIEWARE